MREIQYQSLVLDVVRDAGGAGHKLSNRFLVGVADLLIKLPGREPVLVEVKLAKFAKSTKDGHEFDVGVTVPQLEFLKKYHNAGMKTGVLSFVEHGNARAQNLRVGAFKLDLFGKTCLYANISEHKRVENRENGILTALQELT